ncbi:MAG: hypothetical protein GY827_07580 [Cytophagales bacterium]|nr:hypothetical protein [Cytophagales bacterium]
MKNKLLIILLITLSSFSFADNLSLFVIDNDELEKEFEQLVVLENAIESMDKKAIENYYSNYVNDNLIIGNSSFSIEENEVNIDNSPANFCAGFVTGPFSLIIDPWFLLDGQGAPIYEFVIYDLGFDNKNACIWGGVISSGIIATIISSLPYL